MKKDKRYYVFAAAFTVIFCCAAISAFSVFAKPLQEATGASASQVALTLTINQFVVALFGFISGQIVDKQGPKKLAYVGGVLLGLGWATTGLVTNIWMLYLTCGIIAGIGNGLLYNPCINTALRWFPEKRGTMSGVLLASASLGPLVLAKVGAYLCEAFGTFGLVYIGIAYAVIVVAVAGLLDFPEISSTVSNDDQEGITPKEMLKLPIFWLMIIVFALACTSGIMMVGALSTIAQVQLEITPLVAANFVVVNCLANFIGRLTIGRLCDAVGETNVLIGILVSTIIALIGLRFSTSVIMFGIFLAILGASFGGILVVYPPLNSKMFGIKHSGKNYGIMFFGYSIGAYLGPQIAAQFVDLSLGTSAYNQVYLVAIGVAVVGILGTLLLKIQSKKYLKGAY